MLVGLEYKATALFAIHWYFDGSMIVVCSRALGKSRKDEAMAAQQFFCNCDSADGAMSFSHLIHRSSEAWSSVHVRNLRLEYAERGGITGESFA